MCELASLSVGRADGSRSRRKPEQTEANALPPQGTGWEDLERRLAGYKSALQTGHADP